ncbi:hypothetical protein [Mesorhizobium sp.]|uniref:hypothetical protein n=1 Tax=Mesorhizobium sp. TaxID=1871066 RepID=UPI000FE2F1B4|nr:hypothetical protein [Mesorhizobium sp.]RWQ16082.1 MAG: hypothetical protein EOR92_22665 [Mesorhizobium sp.]
MVELANSIWADGPANSPSEPPKYQIRQWGTWVESLVNLAFSSGKGYTTRAALYANLVPAANDIAIVSGDPTSGNDGLYMKVGATTTGSWTQLTDFVPGTQIVHAVDAGAGTPNAIVATTNLALSGSGAQLVRLDIFEPSTGSPVTVAFNGGSVLTIKTAAGNDPAAGGLTAGPLLGFVSGSTFRLLSDQASAAIVAAAEAALVLSEAARDDAESAANAATGAMTTVIDPQFETVAIAETYEPVVAPTWIRTAGRDSVESGGATYKLEASEPAHEGKFPITTFGGILKWYGITKTELDASSFGFGGQAIQDAINCLVDKNKGGEVTIPAGDWLVDGQLSGDSKLTGILVPYSTQIDPEKRIAIRFSRGAVLKANDNDMIMLRVSDSFIDVHNPIIDANGHTGVWGSAVVPEDMDQTTTRVDQSYVNIHNPFILECVEGVVYQAGPRVAGPQDSACFYNWVHGGHIFNCTRGIWRKAGPNANAATVNAGGTIGVRIGGICNTGIDNEAASGNSDIATGLESINDGTSPHATPTAYRVIQTASTGADNNDNVLSQPRFESNTRDIENANSTTMIVDAKNLSGTKCLFTALPKAISSSSAVLAPQISMGGGLQYQNNAYIAGLPLAILRVVGRGIELDSTDVFKIYDKGHEWAAFALTTSNVTNVDSIGTMLSKYQRTGGFVEWHFRFRFDATVNNVDVVINLPRAAETALYTTTASILAMHVPLFIHDGVSDVARWGVLGATTLTVSPGATWNASSSTNEIHGCIRYREQGV